MFQPMKIKPLSNTYAVTLPDGMLSFIADHQQTDTNYYPTRYPEVTLGYDLHQIKGMNHAMLEKYHEDDMWFDVEVAADTDMSKFMTAVATVLNDHLKQWGWTGDFLDLEDFKA